MSDTAALVETHHLGECAAIGSARVVLAGILRSRVVRSGIVNSRVVLSTATSRAARAAAAALS